ncbi:hypothetical protein [Oleiagrimonas sp.]|jgi:hypothetical protein|uniref:hypothetical protein n=1 Tax=Oleiagrimonas sp. TaxID=2010330 RepID=UPI00262EB9DB|nr:hypothetical protein [Oleiagrimonas sp.]MDA3914497.1 hypothetical protein [Oleiagrimonas sp.]
MKRTQRRILFVVAWAVLLALAAWQWQIDRSAQPGTLLKLEVARITRVRVERPGQPSHVYVRRDGHWWMQAPEHKRVDDGRLDDIAALANAPVQRWRSDTGFDLRKLGLKPPRIRLYLNGQRVDYGVLSPFGPQRYVHVGHRIGLVAAQDTPRAASSGNVKVMD